MVFQSLFVPKTRLDARRGGFTSSCACWVGNSALPDRWDVPSVHVHPDVHFPAQTLSFLLLLSLTHPQKAPWLVTSLVQTHLERPDVRILEVILLSFLVRGQNVDVVEDTDVSRVLAPIRTHPLLNPIWPPRFVTFLRKFVTF